MAIFPHKNLRWVVGLLFLCIFIFVLTLFFGLFNKSAKIFVIVLLLLSIVVCIDTLSLTKISVTLNKSNIALKNTLTHYSITIPWNELHYGYYAHTSKGHKYMILSTKALTSGMQKKCLKDSTMLMSQFINKRDSKEYLCFSVESNPSDQILPYIPPHIVIQ